MPPSHHESTSPSLSARSPSPCFSPGSATGEQMVWDSSFDVDASASRQVSPHPSEVQVNDHGLDSATCLWEDCGRQFSHLPTLIHHIHNEHIGMNKSNYTCEWATCTRRGAQQASRFALISHIRSHTGEKPFTCPLPECDKSFTRSDAMAKHMRLQHNIPPPLPGRGGSRKRKRDESGEADPGAGPQGYAAFKVEGHTPSDAPSASAGTWDPEDGMGISPPIPADECDRGDYFSTRPRRSVSPAGTGTSTPSGGAGLGLSGGKAGGLSAEQDDALPAHLLASMDPHTGKIFGRSPAMVQYLIMKAKHRFALEQHENLLEELRVVRNEERRARDLKEDALNDVLRTYLGPQAEFLLHSPQLIPQQVPAMPESYPVRVETNGVDGHSF